MFLNIPKADQSQKFNSFAHQNRKETTKTHKTTQLKSPQCENESENERALNDIYGRHFDRTPPHFLLFPTPAYTSSRHILKSLSNSSPLVHIVAMREHEVRHQNPNGSLQN